MSSPIADDMLEDNPVGEFLGATLQLDPSSAQGSRSVSPNTVGAEDTTSKKYNGFSDEKSHKRPVFSTAISDPMIESFSTISPGSCKNFYTEEGMSRSFYQQPPIGEHRRASWHDDRSVVEGVKDFFSVRVGVMDHVMQECRSLLDPELDGDVKGTWLLTEINHWDIEKERVVIVCDLSILIVKYDFIALRHLHFTRILFANMDKIEYGEITYPNHSLVPHISGIAGGVATVIRSVIFNRLSTTMSKLHNWRSQSTEEETKDSHQNEPPDAANKFSLSTVSFEPRWRNMQGVRVTWNSNHQVSFSQRWNPFCSNIPYTTFTSHPLYWYSGCEISMYDVKRFKQQLLDALEQFKARPDTGAVCSIVTNDIVVENYLGIASLLHNFGELGFFKLRGKFSF